MLIRKQVFVRTLHQNVGNVVNKFQILAKPEFPETRLNHRTFYITHHLSFRSKKLKVYTGTWFCNKILNTASITPRNRTNLSKKKILVHYKKGENRTLQNCLPNNFLSFLKNVFQNGLFHILRNPSFSKPKTSSLPFAIFSLFYLHILGKSTCQTAYSLTR